MRKIIRFENGMRTKKILWGLLLLILIYPGASKAQLVPTGAGSYTSTFPLGPYSPGMNNLHYYPGDDFYRTGTRQPKVVAGWTGPVPANKWWSSAIWNFETNTNWLIAPYSFMMHPHPLAIGATRYGLRMTYEDNPVVAGTDYHYYREPHIYIGVQGMDIPASIGTKVKSYSDWAMTMRWDDGAGKSLEATSGHGFPFVYFTKSGADVTLRFEVAPTTYSNINNGTIAARGITVLGKNYGIFMPPGTTFGTTYAIPYNEADVPADSGPLCCLNRDGYNATLPAGQNYFSVAVLPDNSPATLAYYAKYAFAFITDTKSTFTYNEATNKVVTTFTATTAPQGSSTETGTLLALYRHQWRHSTDPLTAFQYKSARGDMKVFQGNRFSTQMTNNGFLPSMPNAYSNKVQLFNYVDNEFKKPYLIHFPDKQAGYYAGKNLQRVANLIEIAHQAKHLAARDTFRAYAKRYMQFWFDASGGKNEQLFYYDAKWNSLTAYPSAYESDRQLNDHHFGYGYFVKAAATIARFEPNNTWVTQWGPMVEMLIKDVADWNRNDPQFPYLRNFDAYAGHSWASGHANFTKGNNQESGSESLNFASALALWGLATGNATLRDQGVYMYTTEETAVRQYWFDEDKAVFPPGFSYNFGSIIWGWGAEYQTWFAGDPEHVQGISYLPITGGSLYLGYNPAAAAANYANLVSRTGSATQTTDFKDVIWEYQALSDPATAKSKFFAAGNYTPEGGETMAHTLHWISNLDSMGVVDTTVIADMASFAVFKKGGCKHYVVYNPPAPFNHTCVNYSDGNSWKLPKADSIYVFKKCPAPVIIPTYTVCKGQKLRLAANDSLQGKGSYLWDFNGGPSIAGAKDSVYYPLAFASGQYHVKYGCTFTKGDTFNVVIKDTLSYTPPVYACNGGKFNVAYTITGGSGNAANYSISGVNASAGVTFTKSGNTFTSTLIAAGSYEFLLKDNINNCTQYTIKGSYSCTGCTSQAGTMSSTLVNVCESAAATAPATVGSNLDPDDALLYYLHSSSGATLGTVYATNTLPAFNYMPQLAYGTTYYLSAVAGNKNGTGGIDTTDLCLSVSKGTPVIFNAKPKAVISGSQTICKGNSASLSIALTGKAPWSLTYFDGSNSTSVPSTAINPYVFSVNAAATYTVTAIADANCSTGTASGSATLKVNANPAATISGSKTLCVGSTTQVSVALTGKQPWSIVYTDGTTPVTASNIKTSPFTFTTGKSANYTLVSVSDSTNCSGSTNGNALIRVNPLPASAISGSKEVCQNGPGTPINIALTGTAPWTLTYSDGTTPVTVNNISSSPYVFNTNLAGTYTVSAVSDSGCTGFVFTGNAVITYTKKKSAKITAVKPMCKTDAPFKLNAVDTGGVWSGKGISNSVKGLFSPVLAGNGIQKIKYTIKGACYSDSDTVSITVYPVPLVNLGKDSSICQGDSIRLKIDKNLSGTWQDGSKSNSYLVKTPGTYFVKASNGFCAVKDSVVFNTDCPFSLYVPDAFTPNGDTLNDVFMAKGENVFDFEMSVFNRWGERFFVSNDLKKGWDGKNDTGKESPIDIYVYYIKYAAYSPDKIILRYNRIGHISLIR